MHTRLHEFKKNFLEFSHDMISICKIMTTNIWINSIMKDVPSFIGVCSLDTMVKPISFPSYIIVNFSKSYEPGSHFVTILFLDKQNCLYFDPLNLLFVPQEILNYMFNISQVIQKIEYRVQNAFSIYCGFFCLVPILLHVNHFPILTGLSIFTEGSIRNDELCIDLLSELFKIYYSRKEG